MWTSQWLFNRCSLRDQKMCMLPHGIFWVSYRAINSFARYTQGRLITEDRLENRSLKQVTKKKLVTKRNNENAGSDLTSTFLSSKDRILRSMLQRCWVSTDTAMSWPPQKVLVRIQSGKTAGCKEPVYYYFFLFLFSFLKYCSSVLRKMPRWWYRNESGFENRRKLYEWIRKLIAASDPNRA